MKTNEIVARNLINLRVVEREEQNLTLKKYFLFENVETVGDTVFSTHRIPLFTPIDFINNQAFDSLYSYLNHFLKRTLTKARIHKVLAGYDTGNVCFKSNTSEEELYCFFGQTQSKSVYILERTNQSSYKVFPFILSTIAYSDFFINSGSLKTTFVVNQELLEDTRNSEFKKNCLNKILKHFKEKCIGDYVYTNNIKGLCFSLTPKIQFSSFSELRKNLEETTQTMLELELPHFFEEPVVENEEVQTLTQESLSSESQETILSENTVLDTVAINVSSETYGTFPTAINYII